MTTAIIIPCRNEAGEIRNLLECVLANLKLADEVIVVEGGSYDATWDIVSRYANANDNVTAVKQSGKGKFDAVLTGINLTNKDYVLVWDADGTVSLSDNLKIYDFQHEGNFLITGDRLRGSREPGAMQYANILGNWFFAIFWGLLFHRKPFDSLCGTKKFEKALLLDCPKWLIKRDPYGDFAMLGSALFKRIPVYSFPVDYSARKYGKTNIRRWSGGSRLLLLIIRITLNRNKS
jgi:glycosyltransferase involved in cell wall biosynthesis